MYNYIRFSKAFNSIQDYTLDMYTFSAFRVVHEGNRQGIFTINFD